MANEIVIRNAVKEDMASVYDLIVELAIYENAPNEVTNSTANLIQDGFGDKPLFKCIVATMNEQVVGFALFFESYSTWKGKCLYLEDFIVTEEFRRDGVGKMLFDQLYQVAIDGGYKRFHWQVLDWNEPAISFYKKYKAEMDETWVNCKLVLSP